MSKEFIKAKDGKLYSKTDKEDWLGIYAEYLGGKSFVELSSMHGICRNILKKYFTNFNMHIRDRSAVLKLIVRERMPVKLNPHFGCIKAKNGIWYSKTDREDWLDIHEDYKSGKSFVELATIWGISDITLKKYFLLFNFNLRSSSEVKRLAHVKNEKVNIGKYGVPYTLQVSKFRDKGKNTNMLKYGYEYPNQSPEIKDKIKKTNILKYGYPCSLQNIDIIQQGRDTNILKYGYPSPNQNEDVKNKQRSTTFRRYGVYHAMRCSKISKQSISKRMGAVEHLWNIRLKNKGYTLLGDYTGVFNRSSTGDYLSWSNYSIEHEACGTIFKHALCGVIKCPKCFPAKFGASQKVLSDLIESLGFVITLNDRRIITPKEIDILTLELNIGFEYNGTYHHSSKYKDKHYHKMKSDLALEKGIKLYHVWEHDNLDIVKSMIKSCLGKSEIRYQARKLKVKEVSIKERRDFFDNNHLHGDVNSNFALGLYEGSKLVSCISFRKHKEGIEIARFATLLNSSCVGGFSKLLKHSINRCRLQDYTKIITYCDRDWTPNYKDSVYFKNGFKFVKDTGVQLKYMKTGKHAIYSRETYQKHKLKEMFPKSYSDDKTADQILEENNIYSIHNSGNWKFEMSL